MKIESNLSLDEFKRLLANGAGVKDLLATNIKEQITKTVKKDGGSKSDEPLVEKPKARTPGRGHHGNSQKIFPWLRLPNRPARWLVSGRGYSNMSNMSGDRHRTYLTSHLKGGGI